MGIQSFCIRLRGRLIRWIWIRPLGRCASVEVEVEVGSQQRQERHGKEVEIDLETALSGQMEGPIWMQPRRPRGRILSGRTSTRGEVKSGSWTLEEILTGAGAMTRVVTTIGQESETSMTPWWTR